MRQFAIAILFVIAGYQTDARKLIRVPLSSCVCTADYRPVCGTNGATYSNQCQLGCAQNRDSGIKVECQGSCPCACQCHIGAALSKKCQPECAQNKNVCFQPKVSGRCEAHEMVWFYDITTNRCGQFVYGGCGGNGNRFDTEEECQKTCADPKTQDPCKMPKVVGRCRAGFPSWYYDIKEADCKEFLYGGCDANANNFNTRQQCLNRCKVTQ